MKTQMSPEINMNQKNMTLYNRWGRKTKEQTISWHDSLNANISDYLLKQLTSFKLAQP